MSHMLASDQYMIPHTTVTRKMTTNDKVKIEQLIATHLGNTIS